MTPGTKANQRRKVGLISLGCAKNLVDAEIMLGSLLKSGVEIVNDAAEADALIVNTCGFIDAAQEESVDAILESDQVRHTRRPDQALIVSGCLPQRFREELPKLMPEVDAFMGIDQVEQVSSLVEQAIAHRQANTDSIVSTAKSQSSKVKSRLNELSDKNPDADSHKLGKEEAKAAKAKKQLTAPATAAPDVIVNVRPSYVPQFETPRFRLTPAHFAYVKIAEGCNHPCSFCTIPRMRGSHRSRQQADIVAEAKALIADGVKELNLISQDSTYYGLDLRPNHSRAIASPEKFKAATKALAADATTLSTLIRELNGLKGDFWVRLLYTHPAHWTDELIETIANSPKVAKYVDMPLQHIHDTLLDRMRRETTGQYIRDLIGRIRQGIPGIAIRTTFIVGFPGETEESFETLLDFINETRFERLGVFTYSQEDGTIAGKMAAQTSPAVRKKRRELAMAAQHKISRELAAKAVGQVTKVLIEGEATANELRKASIQSWEHGLIRQTDAGAKQLKGNYWVARGQADAPDIDGRVYVRGNVPKGQFAQVRIIGHTDYDLIAEAVD